MAHVTHMSAVGVTEPAVRKIGLADLEDAILRGIDDFKAKPSFIVFVVLIYPLATLGAFLAFLNYDLLPLVFPVLSGLLLIGPFVTVGLCEVSRRREAGMDISGLGAFDIHNSPSARDIMALGAMLVFLFFLWLTAAMTLYGLTLGDPWETAPAALSSGFVGQLFTTGAGWTLVLVGNALGLMFAITALCIGAISFPLLLDKPVGIGAAVHTSIRAVMANPVIMALWGLFIVASMLVGAATFLVGLCIVIPVLGHATWHLYRKVIAP